MLKLSGNTIVERNDADLISSQLGDDIVLMNSNTGDYMGMNAVGSDIWKLLELPLSLDEVTSRVANMYEVDENYGKDKISSFLQRMLDNKIIQVKA